ncbi:MAG: InlB B-repeat-containing protein, partial [Eubacterium sp.]|nr:InlB B-repeat-containing protein [Eubacterium sp.]
LDMNTEDESDPGVLDTKAGNGTFQDMGGTIQRPSTWQAGEVHTVSVWVMNDANAMSSIKTVAIYIEDNEEEGDVMRPAQSATLTFNANGGSGTAPSNMSVYELQTVTLPNNTFTAPAGMQFGGWQDTTGNVYPEGSDYKVPEDLPSNTMQFNAYWILPSES